MIVVVFGDRFVFLLPLPVWFHLAVHNKSFTAPHPDCLVGSALRGTVPNTTVVAGQLEEKRQQTLPEVPESAVCDCCWRLCLLPDLSIARKVAPVHWDSVQGCRTSQQYFLPKRCILELMGRSEGAPDDWSTLIQPMRLESGVLWISWFECIFCYV